MNCWNCEIPLENPHINQKFCGLQCHAEYWEMNIRMTDSQKEILRVLVEERNGGPIHLNLSASINSLLNSRIVPLIEERERNHYYITEAGRKWHVTHSK